MDEERATKFISQLKDTKNIFDIETVELYDKPIIELKDGQDYKDSSQLSTGQKCTTILPILLLESENPLLVDQPEDNLDNAPDFLAFNWDIYVGQKHQHLLKSANGFDQAEF